MGCVRRRVRRGVSLAENRAAYARKAWLDLVIIAISFPVLPELLALTRLVRLARLGRLLRTLRLIPILVQGFAALGRLFKKRGFGYVTFVFLLVALTTGALFALFEGYSLVDGLWWTVVTLTTVGYGDLTPATPGGRATAVVWGDQHRSCFLHHSKHRGVLHRGRRRRQPRRRSPFLHQRLDRIEGLGPARKRGWVGVKSLELG